MNIDLWKAKVKENITLLTRECFAIKSAIESRTDGKVTISIEFDAAYERFFIFVHKINEYGRVTDRWCQTSGYISCYRSGCVAERFKREEYIEWARSTYYEFNTPSQTKIDGDYGFAVDAHERDPFKFSRIISSYWCNRQRKHSHSS
jgi:hypothetical protein